jgi:hypothetical protein
LSLLTGERRNEIRAATEVPAHIVVVDCLLDQLSGPDERIHGCGRGVGHPKQRFAVDLADDLRRLRPSGSAGLPEGRARLPPV